MVAALIIFGVCNVLTAALFVLAAIILASPIKGGYEYHADVLSELRKLRRDLLDT